MNKVKRTLRTAKNGLFTQWMIVKYATQGTFSYIRHRHEEMERRQRGLALTAASSRELLEFFGIEVKVTYARPDLFQRNYFMVCNHMSYVDIIVLSSCQPAMFVTSVEMEKTFFLGDMAKIGGSFFVDRINRRKIKEEVAALTQLIEGGLNVFVFPEGTSTNGVDGILPFKKSLFRIPYQSQIPILPICLKYKRINNQPFSAGNCDQVAWYGGMTFAPHVVNFISNYQMEVELNYLEPVDPRGFKDHGELALHCEQLIRQAYGRPEDW